MVDQVNGKAACCNTGTQRGKFKPSKFQIAKILLKPWEPCIHEEALYTEGSLPRLQNQRLRSFFKSPWVLKNSLLLQSFFSIQTSWEWLTAEVRSWKMMCPRQVKWSWATFKKPMLSWALAESVIPVWLWPSCWGWPFLMPIDRKGPLSSSGNSR